MSTHPSLVASFVQGATPEFAAVVRRLVDVIDSSGHNLDAAVKWQQLTFAASGDFHHWICSISITRKHVGLNFHYGGLLVDRAGGLSAGSSKFLRKIEYRAKEDVDEAVVRDLIVQAVDKRQYFKDNWKRLQQAE